MVDPLAPGEVTLPVGDGFHFACVGRARGQALRAQLELDSLDAKGAPIHLAVAPHIHAISASFFLGLLGPSVQGAESLEAFNARFRVSASPPLAAALRGYASMAWTLRDERAGETGGPLPVWAAEP